MGQLFDSIPTPAQEGKEFAISAYTQLFVDSEDNVYFYPGVLTKNGHSELDFIPFMWEGKHSTDNIIANKIHSFFRVKDGCIIFDSYVDDGFNANRLFKCVDDAHMKRPCPDTYYGILVEGKEHKAFTRAVFGLDYDEMQSFLAAYSTALGFTEFSWRYGDVSYPRLTRSLHSDNQCDITELWIPKKFPYIALRSSDDHVSLWGFYSHVQKITNRDIDSDAAKKLLAANANKEVLLRILSFSCCSRNKTNYSIIQMLNNP